MLFDCKTYNKSIKTAYFLQKYELMIEIPFVRNEDMLIDRTSDLFLNDQHYFILSADIHYISILLI